MLTSVDTFGHLAAGVRVLDRFICFFSFADLILIQFSNDLRPISQSQKVFNYKDNLCNYKYF